MKTLLIGVLLLTLTAGRVAAVEEIADVILFLDNLYRSDDSYTEMTMHIVTAHWERTLTMKAWSEGSEKTFVRILSPAREAGMATLRIGTEMWNYLPNTNSTVRVPPSMMSGSWMGSDISNNDIVREITYYDDYTWEYTTDSALTGAPEADLLYIVLTPKASTAVVWTSIVVGLGSSDFLPLWERYYDQHGAEMKTITFSDFRDMGGRTIPAVMEVIPADKDGQSTTITWTAAEFNQGVNTDLFTLRNLQSGDN
jgi:outer membrane lipoprotein-sorting protein